MKNKFKVGDFVKTKYGFGFVIKAYPNGIYAISYQERGMTKFRDSHEKDIALVD